MALYRNSLTWTAMFGVIALMFVNLPPMVAKQDSVLNTYSALVEVDALARQRFVNAISDDRLVEGAIRGMMRQLDPYSGYISPEELPGFQRRNRGQYCGVGLEVGLRDGMMTVIAPIEGSPAAHAGMLAGDQLLGIGGRDVERLSTFEVEEMLVGAPDSVVTLRFRRMGDAKPRDVVLKREPVALHTVRGVNRLPDGSWDYWIDPAAGVGYIRVSNFRENTGAEFDAALTQLRKSNLQALILDLRFNPGGFLHQAVAMADRFLSDGLIVSTVNRRSAIDEFHAQAGASDVDAFLVILMNGGSASSSEIVAGALQARGRATVVGERSFGKGSVQHLIQLIGQKAAIKLTVAYYRLPDGRIIHRTENGRGIAESGDWGVRPDVEVVLTPEENHAIQEARRLLDLPPSETDAAGASHDHSKSIDTFDMTDDRQLQAALTFARTASPLNKGG
jgi:carboxyl-terminal processing protease